MNPKIGTMTVEFRNPIELMQGDELTIKVDMAQQGRIHVYINGILQEGVKDPHPVVEFTVTDKKTKAELIEESLNKHQRGRDGQRSSA